MPSHYTQTHRLIGLQTILGADTLLVRGFTGWEGISRPFQFELDLISENNAIDLDKLVGSKATIRIALADGSPRYWHGHISRIVQGSRGPVFTSYRAELVPWLWFLGLRRNCRIFQEKATSDIIREIFTELNLADVEFRIEGKSPKREYCVQYRESDLNFVMRLLEEEGFFFFFKHEEDRHILVIANKATAHPVCAGQSVVTCQNRSGGRSNEDFIQEWRHDRQCVSSGSALADYNFKTPTKQLQSHLNGGSPLEVYDHPGNYLDQANGDGLNQVRLEEIQAAATIGTGEGNCRTFTAGYRFKLQDHYRSELNAWYVLTEVRHHATQAGNFLGDEAAADGESAYRNDFVCTPYKTPFRPVRRTPLPFVEGCQTAIVVGPSGEEIYTDEFGRVKVQFHWDRQGEADEKSSCWIRVAQPWAGKHWGAMAIPRIGQEVVINFLEGNPDRPLIIGSVYNAEQMPPYELPENKTRTMLKSNSTKGGEGFNEIRFDDKKGSEQFYIHAEKDQEIRTKNDRVEWVGRDSHSIVVGDRLDEVRGDDHRRVAGDRNEKVDGALSVQTAMDFHASIGTNFGLKAGTEIYLKSGMNLVVESGTTLTLKVGGSFINLNPGGVSISGPMVMINSGGTAGSGAGISPQPPKLPRLAELARPGEQARPVRPTTYGPTAMMLKEAAKTGAPFCDI